MNTERPKGDSTLTQEINQLHADICSALADTTRILIIYSLAEEPQTVTNLAARVGISQPAASRHLKVLRDRGLVRAERQGPSVEYSLTDFRMVEALDLLRGVLRDRLTHRASLVGTGDW
jgi:DNA-binding transcriptional ArsR family regulator